MKSKIELVYQTESGKAYRGDSRDIIGTKHLRKNSVDLIVTSPPFALEQPKRYEFDEFVSLINSVWSVTKFGYEQIHIEKPSSQQREDGWLDYIMKDYTKVSLSTSIDYVNSTVLSN